MTFFVIRRRWLALWGTCAVIGILAVAAGSRLAVPAFSALQPGGAPVVVVLDPGHGGEDGGAVSTDGTVSESRLNLEIALRIRDLMCFFGQPAVMTRTEDRSIHDAQAKTIQEKKSSDLQNRVALVNEQENALLLSIHQNSLPSSPVTHGAQVFWNGREGAQAWADCVQAALNETVNAGNEKKSREIPDSIYLMKHVTAPAILVECGFLSNEAETRLLQEPDHQLLLAAAVTAGCLAWNGE